MDTGNTSPGRPVPALNVLHGEQRCIKSLMLVALVMLSITYDAEGYKMRGPEATGVGNGKPFSDLAKMELRSSKRIRMSRPYRTGSLRSAMGSYGQRHLAKHSVNSGPYDTMSLPSDSRMDARLFKTTLPGGEFNVLDYGADPSGGKDSWTGIQAAINAAQKQLFAEKAIGGNTVVSLAGGDYVISKSLIISANPHGFLAGRLTIRDGGLVAGWNDTDQYLLQGDFNSINLENLNLDAGHHGGCINMYTHEQSFIHNVFFSHFSTVGLKIGDGHELLLDECNFEEYAFAEDQYAMEHNFTGTAINVGSPDNQFTNTVIKCCKQGIVTKGSNIFSRIHVWPDCANFSIADSYSFIAGPHTRIWGSYMDGSGVLLTDPYTVHILDSLFYGPNGGLTFNFTDFQHESWLRDIIVQQNTFKCHLGCPLIKTLGLTDIAKVALRNVVIRDNHFDNASTTVATYAQKSIVATAREFVVDFTGMLLFPVPVQNCHVQYSFQLLTPNAQIESHYLIPSKGLYDVRVFVVHPNSEVNITGRVYASVDLSTCVAESTGKS